MHPVLGVDETDQLHGAFYGVFVVTSARGAESTRWLLVALYRDQWSAERDARTHASRYGDESTPIYEVRRVGVTAAVGPVEQWNERSA